MADKTGAATRESTDGIVPAKPGREFEPDDALTPAEARRLRQSLNQIREGKTRS
jgi:hypothetical protein